MQHTDKIYQESGFLGAFFFGTVYCRIAGASGGFTPWTPNRDVNSLRANLNFSSMCNSDMVMVQKNFQNFKTGTNYMELHRTF